MPPKIQMKIEEKMFVNLDLHVFWTVTFSIDENFKRGGGVWSRISENKSNPNHVSRKLKFVIFENFTNHGESIRDINEGSWE